MSEYPEHDKLMKVTAEKEAQADLLEWLRDFKGIYLDIAATLAEYHDIDLKKIEAEKWAMLEAIRARQ